MSETQVTAEAETDPGPLDRSAQALDPRNAALGVVGGLVGTVSMTTFRMPISKSLPPTAEFLAKFVGGDPEDYPVTALLLHLVYGAAGGAMFGALYRRLAERSPLDAEVTGNLAGIAYSAPLSAFGSVAVLGGLLGMDLDADERLVFHVGHLVYGVTLGAWVGSRIDLD